MIRRAMPAPPAARRGFTIIELITVIAIIALLATLVIPVTGQVFQKVYATKCMSNLRQIGISVGLYATDHSDEIPKIETNPNDKIYPDDPNAKGMLDTLKPYGLSEEIVKCPVDVKKHNWFAKAGTSYEWRPMIDEEKKTSPVLYGRRGGQAVTPGRIRLATDFESVHDGKMNILYADGKVRGAF